MFVTEKYIHKKALRTRPYRGQVVTPIYGFSRIIAANYLTINMFIGGGIYCEHWHLCRRKGVNTIMICSRTSHLYSIPII